MLIVFLHILIQLYFVFFFKLDYLEHYSFVMQAPVQCTLNIGLRNQSVAALVIVILMCLSKTRIGTENTTRSQKEARPVNTVKHRFAVTAIGYANPILVESVKRQAVH